MCACVPLSYSFGVIWRQMASDVCRIECMLRRTEAISLNRQGYSRCGSPENTPQFPGEAAMPAGDAPENRRNPSHRRFSGWPQTGPRGVGRGPFSVRSICLGGAAFDHEPSPVHNKHRRRGKYRDRAGRTSEPCRSIFGRAGPAIATKFGRQPPRTVNRKPVPEASPATSGRRRSTRPAPPFFPRRAFRRAISKPGYAWRGTWSR